MNVSAVISSPQKAQYNPAGQFISTLHPEPVQRVSPNPDREKASTTEDRISLSEDGVSISRQSATVARNTAPNAASGGDENDEAQQHLSPEEQQTIQKLKARDREVRAHEAAHLAAAGRYAAGGASYTYQQGPDGRRYAVGGEVPIDVGKERTPEQTIEKMRIVRRAAMAPASPSSADRTIAATASQREAQARVEMQREGADAAATSPGTPTESEGAAGSAGSEPEDRASRRTKPNGGLHAVA